MYQAAIVEDDAAILEYLKNTLIQEFDKKGTTVAFVGFFQYSRLGTPEKSQRERRYEIVERLHG